MERSVKSTAFLPDLHRLSGHGHNGVTPRPLRRKPLERSGKKTLGNMMSDNSIAKADILNSIRQNLVASKPFDVVYYEHHEPIVSATIDAQQDVGIADLTLRFKENVESVGAKCSVARTEFEGAAIIQNIITKQEPHRLAISDSPLVNKLF